MSDINEKLAEIDDRIKERETEIQKETEELFAPIAEAYEAINVYVKEKYNIDEKEIPKEFITDAMPCTSCDDGELVFTVSQCNRHIHARCGKCGLNWME